jgi:hypothetical protein
MPSRRGWILALVSLVALSALGAVISCTGAAAASATTGWHAPLEGRLRVLRAFAPPPVSAPWLPGNRGVDLAAPVGASVLAAGAGTVSFAGPVAGRGVVVVNHGVLRTTYEPVDASVRVGEPVDAGAVLGRLEQPGVRCAAAPCLHWGLLRGRLYLDPMSLLGTEVRLLPLLGGARPRLAPAFGPVRAAVPAPALPRAATSAPPVPRGAAPAGAADVGYRTSARRAPSPAVALGAGAALLVGSGAGVLVGRRFREGG